MSRMAFDVIERAPRRRRGPIPLRFLLWTLLLAAVLFWATLILFI